jgi:hypothetical protein
MVENKKIDDGIRKVLPKKNLDLNLDILESENL